MADKRKPVEPRTFFLNELHELDPSEKPGGGGIPKYEGIPWASRAKTIMTSLEKTQKALLSLKDPVRESRYYVLASPVAELTKRSDNKRKAPKGTFNEPTDFGGNHARVFGRLGLDLIHITEDGRAMVHAQKDRFTQLVDKASLLKDLGPREQSRWATIDHFETIPVELRIDHEWLTTIRPEGTVDVVIELQPLLFRLEVDEVLRVIADILSQRQDEKLTGTGTDFSGRHWCRGKASKRSLREIAREFFSVQALHPPLYSEAAGQTGHRDVGVEARASRSDQVDLESLPCVAVVDLGIPADHKLLAGYRRGGVVAPGAVKPPVGDHGSFVASRVVFGDHASSNALLRARGTCSFYDVMVGDYPSHPRDNPIDTKVVIDGLRTVRSVAPDVRVFNLSFGDSKPLDDLGQVERREKLSLLQDLDNFAIAHDVIVVVAAGNSPRGAAPVTSYPDHHPDPKWALGLWACGFNTLICGAFVNRLSARGLVKTIGWPSPFSRIGPGICGAPVPGFSAPGGDCDDTYNWSPGLGVWGYSGTGMEEDRPGTSNAAPILAREAAFTLDRLQRNYSAPGGYPFAVTAKAFLALTATRPNADERIKELTERTLGRGLASAERLRSPLPNTVLMLWQGVIGSPSEKVGLQIPVPPDWIKQAKLPRMRVVAAWDVPVSEAATAKWACRKVTIRLRPGPEARAINPLGRGHETYPLWDRVYDLRKVIDKGPVGGHSWLIETSYAEIADYPPGMDFDPSQRIAFALELFDADPNPVSPQAAMQALPIAAFMTQLPVPPIAVRSPVIIRTRG